MWANRVSAVNDCSGFSMTQCAVIRFFKLKDIQTELEFVDHQEALALLTGKILPKPFRLGRKQAS
jgi:hypothetical protein